MSLWLEHSSLYQTDEVCRGLEELLELPELVLTSVCRRKADWLWETKVYPILCTSFFIRGRYDEKIKIDDLLEIGFMGRTVFCRTFKEIMGTTSAAYLNQIRLKHCHDMMISTTFPLSYISVVCGFCDQSHMVKVYKKYAGVIPSIARIDDEE